MVSVAREGVRLKSAPREPLRLRSAAPDRQAKRKKDQQVKSRYRTAAETVKRGHSLWKGTRYYKRIEFRRRLRPYLPRGSVGAQIGGSLGPECSSCDERTQKQKGPAAEFAKRRLEASKRQKEKRQKEKRQRQFEETRLRARSEGTKLSKTGSEKVLVKPENR